MNEVEKLAAVISLAGIPCRTSTEVMKYLWDKIIYNSALNSLGAILEVNYGKLADMEETRAIMDQAVHEIFAVLDAAGAELLWPDASSYLDNFYRRLIPITADHHPSMLQDIQRGRRTEIDALNGAICRLGREFKVPTPINLMITRLVKAKEQIAELRFRT
jgi:2-dehydropantoate 2-reductase